MLNNFLPIFKTMWSKNCLTLKLETMNAKIFKMNENQKLLEILREFEEDTEIHKSFLQILRDSFSNRTLKITSPEKFLDMLYISRKDEKKFDIENKKLVDEYLFSIILKENLSKNFRSVNEIRRSGNKNDKFILMQGEDEISRRNKIAMKEHNRSLAKKIPAERLSGMEDALMLCSIGSKESYTILWNILKILTHKRIGIQKKEITKHELGS
jgi:glutamyl/glutaminyl-tRNA synthetase